MTARSFLYTLIITGAVAVMISLGVWQWQRAEWKTALLAELRAAPSLPPVDLDRPLAPGAPISFRRARVTCAASDVRPQQRQGYNLRGESGFVFLVPCRRDAEGLAGRLQVVVGWSRNPMAAERLSVAGPLTGQLGLVQEQGPVVFTSDAALPPLERASGPDPDEIPNNHLSYAFQWFFFAAAAMAIALIAAFGRKR